MKYWIIGASSGIGREIAMQLSELGNEVVVSSSNKSNLEKLNEGNRDRFKLLSFDVSNKAEVNEACNIIKKDSDDALCIIYMAARYDAYDQDKGKESKLGNYENIINVNIIGLLHIIENMHNHMKNTKKRSKFIICSSLVAFKGLPFSQPYSLTKAALYNLSSSFFAENHKYFDVKVITPGFVDTPLTRKNKFDMPFIISASKAAQIIIKGLNSKKYEISFPLVTRIIMVSLSIMPHFIYNFLIKKFS